MIYTFNLGRKVILPVILFKSICFHSTFPFSRECCNFLLTSLQFFRLLWSNLLKMFSAKRGNLVQTSSIFDFFLICLFEMPQLGVDFFKRQKFTMWCWSLQPKFIIEKFSITLLLIYSMSKANSVLQLLVWSLNCSSFD